MFKFLGLIRNRFVGSSFYTIFSRFINLLKVSDRITRRRIIYLQIIQFVMTTTNTLALASVVFILVIMQNPKIIEDHKYVSWLYKLSGFEDTQVFLMISVGVLGVLFILHRIFNMAVTLFTQRINTMIRNAFLIRLFNYNLARSHEEVTKQSTDEMFHKQTEAAIIMIESTVQRAASFISLSLNILIVGAFLVTVNLVFSVALSLILVVFYGLVFRFTKRKFSLYGKKGYQLGKQRIQTFRQGIFGHTEVTLMGKGRDYIDIMQRIFMTQLSLQLKQIFMNQAPVVAIQITGISLLFVSMLYIMVYSNPQTAFPIIAVFAGATYRLLPIAASVYRILTEQSTGDFMYAEIMVDLKASKDTKLLGYAETHEKFSCVDEVALDHVSFSYKSEHDRRGTFTVKNITLSVPRGKIVALCGRSGAGKSTVAKLISGLIAPSEGRLMVDGKSVWGKELTLKWRHSVGYVVQSPFFMEDTLAANIAFEIQPHKINYKKVENAIDQACLSEFVGNLPQGIHTEMGGTVVAMSGGQAQRIAIARAVYRDTSMLILDEATSSLDAITTAQVLESLRKIRSEKPILIIAHRPDSLLIADHILVIDDGEVVVEGTYGTLNKQSDLFRSLVKEFHHTSSNNNGS